MKIALLRIGADSGNVGFHSPLFDDGSFEYIPINETYNENSNNFPKIIKENSTYSNTKIIKDKFLIEYIPDMDKDRLRNSVIHHDPEFKSFTYGDPSRTKNGLKQLSHGDYLVFYSSMIPYPLWDYRNVALYIMGYFQIDQVVCVTDISEYSSLQKDFCNNFHVKHWNIFERDVTTKKNLGLKLVKGTNQSRLLKRAIPISEKIPYGTNGAPRFVISKQMQKIFGDFSGKICIQRNALRIISESDYVKKTEKFLLNLE